MPKAQKRRIAPAGTSTAQPRIANASQIASSSQKSGAVPTGSGNATSTGATGINRRFLSPAVSGPQNLVFLAMVPLGCWLIAFYLIFLANDPNHYLFGGLVILMALLWSFSFGIRVRKLRQVRQRSRL